MSAPMPPPAPAEDPSPVTMFGPDFPFAYDDHIAHPAGLGRVPEERHGAEVAVIGAGISGIVTAYELMKLGLKPVVYESDRIGGRLRSETFKGGDGTIAELGAMRFPPSSTTLFHYLDKAGLRTRPFPNPLTPACGSTVIELGGQAHTPAGCPTCRPCSRRSPRPGRRCWSRKRRSGRCRRRSGRAMSER